MTLLNICDFGARGDGSSFDTAAIQRAIDAAAETGAAVVIPAGNFLTGTLHLRSNTLLFLEKGAVLHGLSSPEGYEEDLSKPAASQHRYLLWGKNVQNVRIRGEGVIDGHGPAFWQKVYFDGRTLDNEVEQDPLHYNVLKPLADRPTLIYLEKCRHVEISGITIRNAPCYTVWWLGCEDGVLNRVTVRNPRNGPNTDCFDIDCCSRIRITNCDLDAGDDCIALKSDNARLGEMQPCEKITVEKCRLSSATCGVRIGFEGDAPIRDCIFRDLVIENTRHGLDMLSIAPGPLAFTTITTGTPISGILFENITMKNVGNAVYFWAGNNPGVHSYNALIRDITLRNVKADSLEASFIGSVDKTVIGDILLDRVSLHLERPLPPGNPDFVPGCWGVLDESSRLGAVLVLRKVHGITLNACSLTAPENTKLLDMRMVTGFTQK